MLAALLQNNNNARREAQPGFKVDPRASGGRSRVDRNADRGSAPWQGYDFADIIAAAATFPEVAGEGSTARTARLHRWINEALPRIKDAREKRDAVVFLAGARLADAAAEERHAAQARAIEELHAAQNQLKIEQIVEIINEVRRETVPSPAPSRVPHERGARSTGAPGGNGIALFVGGLVVGGIMVGIALHGRAPRR